MKDNTGAYHQRVAGVADVAGNFIKHIKREIYRNQYINLLHLLQPCGSLHQGAVSISVIAQPGNGAGHRAQKPRIQRGNSCSSINACKMTP